MPLSELVAASPAELLGPGEAFWQALAVVRAEREEADAFRSVFIEALERLAGLAETDRLEWEWLLRMLLGWGLLRRDRREHASLIAAVRQSRLSALLQEEITQMIQNLEQTWEQELLALGATRGRTEGLAEGRAEGLAEGLAEDGTTPNGHL
jgi:flagellar biosynthesis/type III secretory pathway protein FliH